MEITLKHYGNSRTTPSKIIEITVKDWGGNSSITEDITNLKGKVDEDFIASLRNIADELEEQNKLVENLTK